MEPEVVNGLIQALGAIVAAIIVAVASLRAARLARAEESPPGSGTGPARAGLWPQWVLLAAAIALLGFATYRLLFARQTQDVLPVHNLVEYFDFAKSAVSWQDVVRSEGENWADPVTEKNVAILPSSRGERGVTYGLKLAKGKRRNYVITYGKSLAVDLVSGHFYLPDTPDIASNWVGFSANDSGSGAWLAESGEAVPLGKWVKIVLDLRGRYGKNDIPLSSHSVTISAFYVIWARDTLQSETVEVRLDDVAFYTEVGTHAVSEQRGPGRILFDFEGESVQGWQVRGEGAAIEAVDSSPGEVYRGDCSLSIETVIESGGKVFVRRPLVGTNQKAIMMARVLLPADAPEHTHLWASLYAQSHEGYGGSETCRLSRGVWHTLVWDMAGVNWSSGEVVVGIQIGSEGSDYSGSLYVDDIQLLENVDRHTIELLE